MSEMVERVARAIIEKMRSEPVDMLDAARAAIAAMWEPTEAMVSAGVAEVDDHDPQHEQISGDDTTAVWRAMIDEALKP